ncbi:MAG: YihA family ribosome biogenesis GTP-binding protein [Gammaproteobacteria bacterium CG11_big_fil_rev_8_21_14_0_20_46_22]|nr:MAG: YihA family ribosome biogenesis GTP-binding protein [Gammaproteobacteria bacterium CG12_big_fil_rev_8_21_14_0_65_46_12]PIR11503.1 MAG: YihA family ribosome biogenesis GTP-binding protein [Gammaproteobacteria bacterium CG11_big_fil_rev_8_21_14_0_20_46_22]
MRIAFQKAHFLLSVASVKQLPPDTGAEIAFAGRSNAGKSSALNTLTQQKSLARTSKTPGRTQLINFFEIDNDRRLVDLPGYGYAKVPEAQKQKWQALIDAYFRKRESLVGLVLLMDIRHPLKPFDEQVIAWAKSCSLPLHILLTKSDKLKYGAAKKTLDEVKRALPSELISVQLFSSLKKTGLDECEQVLSSWMCSNRLGG